MSAENVVVRNNIQPYDKYQQANNTSLEPIIFSPNVYLFWSTRFSVRAMKIQSIIVCQTQYTILTCVFKFNLSMET